MLPALSSEAQLAQSALSSDERDTLAWVEKENADGTGEAGTCVRRRKLRRISVLCGPKEGSSLLGENGVRSPFDGDGGLVRPVRRAKKARVDEEGGSGRDASVEAEKRERSCGAAGENGEGERWVISQGTRDSRGGILSRPHTAGEAAEFSEGVSGVEYTDGVSGSRSKGSSNFSGGSRGL